MHGQIENVCFTTAVLAYVITYSSTTFTKIMNTKNPCVHVNIVSKEILKEYLLMD